ncbi:YihY/virulence factor BrkB family protein [Agrococcus jejuensis]|uniref:Membrane protein n=1 Tax=Agrococcus jejuensis TaxID=399736 RepID=A0A1G8F9D1_9MICO|nr:YihY/virulence factor BrkB family protein [Agrococcus jejuensis]SDH78763.1 membrane protein [Agrococcus jejuensis]
MRALQHYGAAKGPVFAQGMTLSAFLSLFAALFIGFAIFAAVLGGNDALRDRVIEAVAGSVPGLLGTGPEGEGGVIPVDTLLQSSVLSWGSAIAAVAILITAIGWIGVSREGFRAVFHLPDVRSNAIALKAGDLGVAVGIGLLVLASAALLVVTSAVADALGIGGVGQVVGLLAQLALDAAIVALLYRFAGRLRLPWSQLIGASLACAVAFAVLKQFAALLLTGGSNPLVASFAAILGILVWLGFVNQILLVALSWLAVGETGKEYVQHVDAMNAREDAIAELRADRAAIKAEIAERKKDDPKQGLFAKSLQRRLAKQARKR